jgi:hypothetical protein
MSIATIIIGESGSGKTTSLRNLNPQDVLLIQTIKKPLPFRSAKWTEVSKDNPSGSIFVNDNAATICTAMQRTKKPIIIIDDFQYLLAGEFMRRSDERGFDKFIDIGRHAWDVLTTATLLGGDVRVYIMAHSHTDDSGKTKVKTIGKLLDEKITVEGLVSIVLKTVVRDGSYLFSTRNSGHDTCKTPIGLFDKSEIDNDLAMVDKAITEYYFADVPA